MARKTRTAWIVAAAAIVGVAYWIITSGEPPGQGGAFAGPSSPDPGGVVDAPAVRRADDVRDAIEKAAFADADEHVIDPSESTTGRLALRLLWGNDDSPAAGVSGALAAGTWRGSGAERDPIVDEMTSDEEGRFPVVVVPVGMVTLRLYNGLDQTFVVDANETTREDVRIPRGVEAAVSVVDPSGGPVADAEIWLGKGRQGGRWSAVGRTGSDGTRVVSTIGAEAFVAVKRDGYEPSQGRPVDGKAGERVPVAFRLKPGGGTVSGVAKFADGSPAVGAVVRTSGGGMAACEHEESMRCVSAPPQSAVADEEGRFALRGLASGEQSVSASARGVPHWTGKALVHAFVETNLTINFGGAAHIAGSIVDETDAPIGGLDVELVRKSNGNSAPVRKVQATKEGSFEFEGVEVGSVALRVKAGARGSCDHPLELVAGETRRVALRLNRERTISGVVVSAADGAPMSGSLRAYRIVGAPGAFAGFAPFGDEKPGAFAINLDEVDPVDIEFRDVETRRVAFVEAVPPGGPALVVRAARLAASTARIRFRTVDAEGKPLSGGNVAMKHDDDDSHRIAMISADGRFDTGLIQPGGWTVKISKRNSAAFSLGRIELAASEVRDLGDVVWPKCGTLVAVIRKPNGEKLGDQRCLLRSESDPWFPVSLYPVDGRFELTEGAYELVADAGADDLAPIVRKVAIKAGVESTIEATFDLVRDAPGFVDVRVEVEGVAPEGRGKFVYVTAAEGDVAYARLQVWPTAWTRMTTRVGRQRFCATDAKGRTAEEFVDVPSKSESTPKVVLRIR